MHLQLQDEKLTNHERASLLMEAFSISSEKAVLTVRLYPGLDRTMINGRCVRHSLLYHLNERYSHTTHLMDGPPGFGRCCAPQAEAIGFHNTLNQLSALQTPPKFGRMIGTSFSQEYQQLPISSKFTTHGNSLDNHRDPQKHRRPPEKCHMKLSGVLRMNEAMECEHTHTANHAHVDAYNQSYNAPKLFLHS